MNMQANKAYYGIGWTTIFRDEILVYDGNLVSVAVEVEIEADYCPGDYDTPPAESIDMTDFKISVIAAEDADDEVIEVDCNDPTDPYVQSVKQHIDQFGFEFDADEVNNAAGGDIEEREHDEH